MLPLDILGFLSSMLLPFANVLVRVVYNFYVCLTLPPTPTYLGQIRLWSCMTVTHLTNAESCFLFFVAYIVEAVQKPGQGIAVFKLGNLNFSNVGNQVWSC